MNTFRFGFAFYDVLLLLVRVCPFHKDDNASASDAQSENEGDLLSDLNVDLKVTSIKQPQSSSPFRSAQQKVRGLGYSLLVFVYQKTDDNAKRTGKLQILHTIFVDAVLYGTSPLKWRSGVKHDCSRVMELRPNGDDDFENGLGEVVSLESIYTSSPASAWRSRWPVSRARGTFCGCWPG